jgi:hypothetical protein
MERTLLAIAAIIAASSVDAREPKKNKDVAPPPPPEVEYELDDEQFGEELAEACIASPAEQETYDSRDNVLITRTEDGGRAFFHFEGGCDTNTMIFADAITAEGGDACVSAGEALVFTSSYGGSKKCVVEKINRWLDDELISPEYGR